MGCYFSGHLVKLPFKPLLLVLGLAATAYAVALFFFTEQPLPGLLSFASVQAALLCVTSYVLRGLRWRLWLAHYGRTLPLMQGLRLYVAGYTFTPTPGNVGEALRGLLLKPPLSGAHSVSIFGAERLADLLCLLLLAGPAAYFFLSPAVLVIFIAACFVFGGGIFFLRKPLCKRLPWLTPAWHCLSRNAAVWLALTLSAWALQGVAVWLLCVQAGVSITLVQASSFYALAMVGGALSMLPAGLGGMEVLLVGLLLAHGATTNIATSITVVVRVLTLWLAVGLGALSLFYSAFIRKEIHVTST